MAERSWDALEAALDHGRAEFVWRVGLTLGVVLGGLVGWSFGIGGVLFVAAVMFVASIALAFWDIARAHRSHDPTRKDGDHA